jgi:hypothetical protein
LATKKSGSEKLLAGARGSCSLDQAELRRFVSALSAADLRVIDWHCKGQPVPDFITGSMDVASGDVGRAAEVLVKAGSKLRVNWEVFPNGIPIPDVYRIKFSAGGPA